MDVAVILIGQPRTGKSLALNCLLGAPKFVHAMGVRPVTTEASNVLTPIRFQQEGEKDALVWNLRGMGELGGENAELNRVGLQRAFDSAPRQVVMFLLQHRNGRMRHEDVALFMQLMRVYRLQPESTIVLMGAPPPSAMLAPLNENEWVVQTRNLFCRATGFESLRHFGVLHTLLKSRAPGCAFDLAGAEAYWNATVMRILLAQCVPYSHSAHGQIVLEAERLEEVRLKISQLEQKEAEDVRHHETEIKAAGDALLEAKTKLARVAFSREEWNVEVRDRRLEMERTTAAARAALQHENDQWEAEHRRIMNEIERADAAHRAAEADFERQLAAAREQNARIARDRRNLLKQIESVGRHLIRHPVKLLPVVASAVLMPYAAPAVASALGCGTVVGGAIVGGAVGAASAAVNRQPILPGIAAGLVTGGAGAGAAAIPAANAAVSIGTAAVVRAGGAAVGAVITRDNVASAAVGAAVGGAVGAHAPIANEVVRSTAASVSAAAASAVVANPRDLAPAMAASLIHAAVGAAVAAAVPPMISATEKTQSSPLASPRPRPQSATSSHESTTEKTQSSRRASPQPEPRPQPASPTSGGDRLDSSRQNALLASLASADDTRRCAAAAKQSHAVDGEPESTATVPSVSASVSVDPSGRSARLSVGDISVSTNNTVGFTVHNDDGSTTRWGGGESSIYTNGGTVLERTDTTFAGPQRGGNTITLPKHSASVIHQDVGACFATRVVQRQSTDVTGIVATSLTHEQHFNTESCLGDPARAVFTAGVVTAVAPPVRLVLPLATAIVTAQ